MAPSSGSSARRSISASEAMAISRRPSASSGSIPFGCGGSSAPSRRITHSRVVPCSTSVARMAVKARKTIRSRSGKSSGRASAAARLTTPRIPAQEMTARWLQGGAGSRLRLPGSARGSSEAGKTQRKRDRISAAASAERDAEQLQRPAVADAAEDGVELQPDQHEDQAVQDELDEFPDRAGIEPVARS